MSFLWVILSLNVIKETSSVVTNLSSFCTHSVPSDIFFSVVFLYSVYVYLWWVCLTIPLLRNQSFLIFNEMIIIFYVSVSDCGWAVLRFNLMNSI